MGASCAPTSTVAPEARSKRVSLPEQPPARMPAPSGVHLRSSTGALRSPATRCCVPATVEVPGARATSNTYTLLSQPPEARCCPLGEKPRQATLSASAGRAMRVEPSLGEGSKAWPGAAAAAAPP